MEPTRSLDHLDQSLGESYLDTVTLLQAEIERLEAELRMWTESTSDPTPAVVDSEAADASRRRIDELSTLLEERDETISLLWDHLSTIEEAQAARSAEWEQLHLWVEELERHLNDTEGGGITPGPAPREVNEIQARWDTERSAWEVERRRLESEVQRLQRRLDSEEQSADDALNRENRELVEECRRLSAFEAEANVLKDRLAELQTQLDRSREQLWQAKEQHDRERSQQESDLADLRAGGAVPTIRAADMPPHERVRALREHLKEIHAREEEERKERQLSSRIARLLGRTGARR